MYSNYESVGGFLSVVVPALVSLWLGPLAVVVDPENTSGYRALNWSKISAESMVEIPIKPIIHSKGIV